MLLVFNEAMDALRRLVSVVLDVDDVEADVGAEVRDELAEVDDVDAEEEVDILLELADRSLARD